MCDVEKQVQNNIVSFCKLLPQHVDTWRAVLQESVKVVESLCNQAEQLRHVEKAKIKHLQNFEDVQKTLQFHILLGIEDEVASIQTIITKLNKANQELKNKLTLLEKSTIPLDWEEETLLIKGTGTQPSLRRLLQNSLEFWLYFSNAFKKIYDAFRTMNVRKEENMKLFENVFNVDLDNRTVTYLIALTQYVDNKGDVL